MPTIEEIYLKLTELEQQISAKDGFALADDTIADFFNINTLPGREAENPAIAELVNVQVANGNATLIKPAVDQNGLLVTKSFQTQLESITSVCIRPINEDIRAQYIISATDQSAEERELGLEFAYNQFAQNVELIPNSGQGDFYGAHLVAGSNITDYTFRETFAYGQSGALWFVERTNVEWKIIDLYNNNSATSVGNVLQCKVTEPLNYFAMPQYSLNRFGVALWSDTNITHKTEMRIMVTPIEGATIKTGIAFRMHDILNGYFAMLESDISGSFVRLYKTNNGLITQIATVDYSGELVLNKSYEMWVRTLQENIEIYVDGILVLSHSLVPVDIVSVDGDFGVITGATTTVRYTWIEMQGQCEGLYVAAEGTIATDPINVGTDISRWTSIELSSSIISGNVELEYSIDQGSTFSIVPYAIIQYPSPVAKKFSLESIPIQESGDNVIIFRARLVGTGANGWLHGLRLIYASQPVPPFELTNVTIADGTFKLLPDAHTGTIVTKHGFLPELIYRWTRFVADDFNSVQNVPPTNITNLAIIQGDSHQDEHSIDLALDADLNTYWESLRGQQSWVLFDFPHEVVLTGFRWVKKSPTDGATFYKFQKYSAESNTFEDIETYGFEVNEDIRHDFVTPAQGQRFRLLIECVQPMSFGNARLIEIFGHSEILSTNIQYEYSFDGVQYLPIGELKDNRPCSRSWDLSFAPTNQPIKLRATLNRSNLSANVYVRKFGAIFVGRDRRAQQITDLKYDLQIGDRQITNAPINQAIDVRCAIGNTVQMKVHFSINPALLFLHMKPVLAGYKILLSSSKSQAQIDMLQAQINGVIQYADKDPGQTRLVDAILCLIAQQTSSGVQDKAAFDSLLTAINREIAKNRSRIVMGDVGHLDETLPSEVFDANILL